MDAILRSRIDGRYHRQHVVSGSWIADFFVPEVRLAIEIDGSIHSEPSHKLLDEQKELEANALDITVLRITNDEVFGDRSKLLQRLRRGWIKAKNRPNRIIGKPWPAA